MKNRESRPYWNPYLVGTGIGLLIILSFVVTGRGLGAIGAFNGILASLVHAIAPDYALSKTAYSTYLAGVDHPLKDWVVIEIAGVCIGGLLSGIVSRRFRFEVIKGPRISNLTRLIFAFSGGMLMAVAAKFTRGCTSGLALSGGSVLSPGAWLFMISVFIGGYSIAWLMKKAWN
ncbi:MAG: YeeE/YedE thiosulfate transporter family protein [Bacteroidales bacterium]|nr:YeeE/YedE thiosulfate transporter family protein [Bacteroidales bacterium]